MNAFYEGLLAGVGMLGGICAFNYWVFSLLEKRLETKLEGKLEKISLDLESIVADLKEERATHCRLYQFVLDATKK